VVINTRLLPYCGKIKFMRLLFNKFEVKLVNVFISILRFEFEFESLHLQVIHFSLFSHLNYYYVK